MESLFAKLKCCQEKLREADDGEGFNVGQMIDIIEEICDLMKSNTGVEEEALDPKSNVPLSIQQQKVLVTSVEIIIAIGLYPNLSPGVGVPLALRMKNAQEYSKLPGTSTSLKACLRFLLSLFRSPPLCPIISSKFLADLLTATFQLEHDEQQQNVDEESSVPGKTQQIILTETAEEIIEEIRLAIPPSHFVPQLLLLQSRLPSQPGGNGKTIISAPSWFQIAVGRRLTDSLHQLDGLRTVIEAMTVTTGRRVMKENRKFADSLALIVTRVPKKASDHVSVYHASIARQTCQLMMTAADDMMGLILSAITFKLWKLNPAVAETHILNRIAKPLEELKADGDEGSRAAERSLRLILGFHHYHGPSTTGETGIFNGFFRRFDPLFFTIYCDTYKSIQESTRNVAKSLMLNALDVAEGCPASNMVNLLINSASVENVPSDRQFVAVESGLKILRKSSAADTRDAVTPAVNLMQTERPRSIPNLLVETLIRLVTLTSGTTRNGNGELALVAIVRLESMLSQLVDKAEDFLTNDPKTTIEACHKLLVRIRADKSKLLAEKGGPFVCGILSAMAMAPDQLLGPEVKSALMSTNQLLTEAASAASCPEFSSLAAGVMQIYDEADNSYQTGDETKKKKQTSQKQPKKKSSSELAEALRDLRGPLEPTRGHGLITVGRLARHRDVETLERFAEILALVMDQLSSEDSYIFMLSINALSDLGDAKPTKIFHVLLPRFLTPPEDQSDHVRVKIAEVLVKIIAKQGELTMGKSDELLDVFLSLCHTRHPLDVRTSAYSCLASLSKEIPLKLYKNVNELIYSVEKCLETTTTGVDAERTALSDEDSDDGDAEATTSMSKNAGRSQKVMMENNDGIEGGAAMVDDKDNDKAVEMLRRSAVHLLRNMIQTSRDQMLQLFSDHMSTVYELLRRLAADDRDEVVQVHAQLALVDVNENMAEAIKTPSAKASGKIIELN